MNFKRSEPVIVITNQSTLVKDAQIEAMIPGLQSQVTEDFYPAWGLTAKIIFGTKPDFPHMELIVKDQSDEAGDLGYHFRDGYPLAYIFARDSMAGGAGIDGLSTTISHEILEMIADPGVNLLAACPPPDRSRKSPQIFSYEACDPVEANSYRKLGVAVSNFVFPEWFEPEHRPGEMAMDFLGVTDAPFKLAPGGYVDLLVDGKWKTQWGPLARRKPKAARHRLAARR